MQKSMQGYYRSRRWNSLNSWRQMTRRGRIIFEMALLTDAPSLVMIMVQTFRVPVILLYHSVRYAAGGSIYRISITPERFQRHVSFLTSNFRVVPLQEFVDALASRTRIEGMACITFDDGYVDNLEAARDILCKHRTSATIFIPTGFVGRPYFWWDALHTISTAASRQPDKAHREMQAQFPALRGATGITEAEWFNVWDRMRRHPLDDAYAAVGELAARLDVDLKDLPRPVTSRELKDLAKWPFKIGSHAESHRPLPSLSIEEVRSELQASRAYLESSTGRSVAPFHILLVCLITRSLKPARTSGIRVQSASSGIIGSHIPMFLIFRASMAPMATSTN